MKQILYGVGKSVLKDFKDPKQIVALSKLKDVTIQFTGDEEPVTGGDSPYPIAFFPRDKAITVTATNALFNLKMVNVTQGATITMGTVNMTEFIEGEIPADGIFELDYTPLDDTVVIEGFDEVKDSLELQAGKFFVSENEIHFAEEDAGIEIEGIYERSSSENAQTISVMKDTFAKPFVFIHRIPVYNDNNTVVAEGQLIIFKAKANNNFEFNLQPQTAFAPRLELNALDAKRKDKKLWDFTIDPVA